MRSSFHLKRVVIIYLCTSVIFVSSSTGYRGMPPLPNYHRTPPIPNHRRFHSQSQNKPMPRQDVLPLPQKENLIPSWMEPLDGYSSTPPSTLERPYFTENGISNSTDQVVVVTPAPEPEPSPSSVEDLNQEVPAVQKKQVNNGPFVNPFFPYYKYKGRPPYPPNYLQDRPFPFPLPPPQQNQISEEDQDDRPDPSSPPNQSNDEDDDDGPYPYPAPPSYQYSGEVPPYPPAHDFPSMFPMYYYLDELDLNPYDYHYNYTYPQPEGPKEEKDETPTTTLAPFTIADVKVPAPFLRIETMICFTILGLCYGLGFLVLFQSLCVPAAKIAVVLVYTFLVKHGLVQPVTLELALQQLPPT